MVEGAGEEEGRKGGLNDQTPDWGTEESCIKR